jgi:hypothetical protein
MVPGEWSKVSKLGSEDLREHVEIQSSMITPAPFVVRGRLTAVKHSHRMPKSKGSTTTATEVEMEVFGNLIVLDLTGDESAWVIAPDDKPE